MKLAILSLAAALAVILPALAQHGSSGQISYKGFETRAIKALSNEQIDDLRNGRGMGLALAAELNDYPGPLHVIEFAEQLSLSPDTAARVRALFEAMKAEAIPIGERLIAEETELDSAFSGGSITPDRLVKLTRQIGETNAALRAAHLKYHLETKALLTAEQIRHYAVLRGYANAASSHHQKRH